MFEPAHKPRVFALAPGVDFPRALIDGILARLDGQPPEALARVHLIVNTRRMARRVRELFDTGPARLLPRVSLVTDLGETLLAGAPPVSPLRRQLELAQLIRRLLDAQPDLAARSATFDLADSLATLIDEMQGEGIGADVIRALDVTDMSGHWERAKDFIGIADTYLKNCQTRLDPQQRHRRAVEALAEVWAKTPPQHPILVAGSTGSRGTTRLLMQAVARLPQGAVILPGFDFDQPDSVWRDMNDALVAEDHPQFRFCPVLSGLGLSSGDVRRWTEAIPPSPARNKLVSLALRPAPFTDAWLDEGPGLVDLHDATRDVTLIEAPGPRAEALAIALRLRHAAETGQIAALITPDRMLTRRVSAALDRWHILPDDSAGTPLHLSPPGRILRHVAQLFSERLTGERLMTLLKHPLCHSGADRGMHLLQTRSLELYLRRNGPPYPDPASLSAYRDDPDQSPSDAWIDWVSSAVCNRMVADILPLTDWVDRLRRTAESIASGSKPGGTGALWGKQAGQAAAQVMAALEIDAAHGGDLTAREFGDLLHSLLSREEVRDRDAPHDRILIWGTLEARVQGADLLILGGLNEGTWPEAAQPDPWLNRKMRLDAGLLLPERRIGLSAHDFQQAIAANEVWLTRSRLSEDAETVPSRWLNRLTNLLSGLPEHGTKALGDMRARGQDWLDRAILAEEPTHCDPAPRPSPRPPVQARPRQLSVTEIKRLIRDPYAIYARHVLRLKPLDPLVREPDALLRGIVVHDVLEEFVKATLDDPDLLEPKAFLDRSARILSEKVPWPVAQRLWQARLTRVADAFVASERRRQSDASPWRFEAKARLSLDPLDFTLVGRADRIDRDASGGLIIYDYKTGPAPSRPQQARFDKQLLIEAAMAETGAFLGFGAAPVTAAVFISLGGTLVEVAAPLDTEPPAKVLGELRELIQAYFQPTQGYTARRMVQKDSDTGDYDHLARFGEWDRSSKAKPEDLV